MFMIISTACLCSCKKDSSDSGYLKRNTDQLSFTYNESTATFTVRATGNWSISIPDSSSWVSVSPDHGTGDGSTYQTVEVTCQDNSGEARTGVIYLNGGGQQNVPVNISQANGVFEWQTAGGAQFSLNDLLIKGAASTTYIAVPYVKATGKESINAEVSISGQGASGLSVSSSDYTLDQGDGYLKIPIIGTPTSLGQVDISLKINGEDFGSVTTLTGVGGVALTQDFSKFPWGSDFIGNKAGVTTTQATATMALSDETKAAAIGTLGANGSGVTSTIRSSNPSFYTDIGMDGWTGYRNYMLPGYIQLGAASSTAGEYGSLVSPALNLPGGTYDLLVTFKLAIYKDPAPDKIVVGLIASGSSGITTSTYSSITNSTAVPISMAAMQWFDFSCVVKNATSASSLVITLPSSLVSGGVVGPARIYVDDIKVAY